MSQGTPGRAQALSVFSIAAEALNFGWRRFETVLRVGWLPVSLMLVFNMATAFLWLSLAYGRTITFTDVAASGSTWGQVLMLAQQKMNEGLATQSSLAWGLWFGSLLVTAILVASFMAPLIRYAGLGEKPAPGVIRAPFGPDQIRFLAAGALATLVFAAIVYAPMTTATVSILDFINQAMSTPYASFPDRDSLHTVEIITGTDRFGVRWLYGWQVWGAGAALLGSVLLIALFAHLAPTAGDRKAGIGGLGRALGVALGLGVVFGLIAWFYLTSAEWSAAQFSEGSVPAQPPIPADGLGLVLFAAAAALIATFVGLRVFPYAGVAVCRRSMALAGSLRVTRRYNLFRLGAAFLLLGVILFFAQLLIMFAATQVLSALAGLVEVAESGARLGGGEKGAALEMAKGLWAALVIGVNMVWTLFTYGVTAGLFGRLYRESERI